jgi:hypothetical protein
MGTVIGSGASGRTETNVALEQRMIEPAGALAQRDHLRRCTFRRLSAIRRGVSRLYAVDCLYPDRSVPVPLGDLQAAQPICDACVAAHVFRPDED